MREWKKLKLVTDGMIKRRKKRYYEKECSKLQAHGAHTVPYKALKSLSVAERPPSFDPSKLKPELSESELVEDLAGYFGRISEEFTPLDRASLPHTYDRPVVPLTQDYIRERLIQMNKPKLSVSIDPLSNLVNIHADIFSGPLTFIINAVRNGAAWPSLWAEEEVSIIPKSSNVTDYSGCRNISCTSVFSKLCESFMLEDLADEVTLRGPQFGGMKGSGPPHLLIELLTNMMEQLDDNRAAVTTI